MSVVDRDAGRGLVLVVDDEEAVRDAVARILEDEGYRVLTADSGEAGVQTALSESPDVLFLDVWLPGIDGIETLRLLRERGVQAPVIMISGHGTIETAVRATKRGAYDFVEKPVSLERILLVTANALRHSRLERRNRALRAEMRREAEFLGNSPEVDLLRRDLAAAADGRPVLLYGEKGTGRRLAARWLALHGPRPEGPFLDLPASAFPRERLLLSLFGDPARRGEEPGRLALADEGTLYIENAEALPAGVQEALAAGVERGLFPVPGTRLAIRAELLLIVSLMEAPGKENPGEGLRPEFLGLFPHAVRIPPLRRRGRDIPLLAARFLEDLAREYARPPLVLAPRATEILMRHSWPGNIRELQRVAERLVLLAPGPEVSEADLPPYLSAGTEADPPSTSLLDQLETQWLRLHLQEAGGDLARAAARLGISEEALRGRLEKAGLNPPSQKPS